MNRRSFLFYTAAATIGSMHTGLVFARANAPEAVTVDLSKDLLTVGSSKTVRKVIVVRTGKENALQSFAAFSNKCTHRGCKVSFNQGKNEFECPCHGSKFSIKGDVTQGPAKKALTPYTVSISGQTLTVIDG